MLGSLLHLETGADPTLENENGHKPLAYVKSPAIKGLLEEHEEKVQLSLDNRDALAHTVTLFMFKLRKS